MAPASELLLPWLSTRIEGQALEWLRTAEDHARAAGADRAFLLAFGTAPRRVGKASLGLTDDELAAAGAARPGFRPEHWTVDQTARTVLVLALPAPDAAATRATLDRLFDDGDLGELVALYQALPLLPHPEAHRARAAEGIRANMKPVFEAVALRNPYPAEQLDEAAFNQLVMKCVFVGSPLHLVHGLDARSNPTLARMLGDFAHERWAAGRPVAPELWRLVGPHASGSLLDDLERVLASGADRERAAVALASHGNREAERVLGRHEPAVRAALARFGTWADIAADA